MAMQHGIDHEDEALAWVNSKQELSLVPICAEDDTIPYFKASLDGWDEEKKIVCEVKYPVSFKTIDNAKEGIIHPYWIDQVLWQAMVSDALEAFIAIWDFRNQTCIIEEIHIDKVRILEMRRKGHEFWKGVKYGKPPAISDKDYITIEDTDLQSYLFRYQHLDQKIKGLEFQKKDVKSLIEDFGDDGNFTAYGFKIVRCPSRVSYDMEKMKSDGIDVEKYQKKSDSIGYYKIILPKGDK